MYTRRERRELEQRRGESRRRTKTSVIFPGGTTLFTLLRGWSGRLFAKRVRERRLERIEAQGKRHTPTRADGLK